MEKVWRRIVPSQAIASALRSRLPRWPLCAEPATFSPAVGDREPVLLRRRGVRARAWRLFLRARYLLLQRRRARGPAVERVAGYEILVLPGVFNPKLFRSGEFLAAAAADPALVPHGCTVLDLGTGSGAAAIAAAARAARVVAVDINPVAVDCARLNVQRNGVAARVDVRHGDLFDPVAGERFYRVLFNPPFFRGVPRDMADAAWRAPDVAERFAAGLAEHLEPGGQALVVLSSDGDAPGFLQAFRDAGLDAEPVAHRDLVNELLVLFRVAPAATTAPAAPAQAHRGGTRRGSGSRSARPLEHLQAVSAAPITAARAATPGSPPTAPQHQSRPGT